MNLKKITAIVISLLMVLSMTACQSREGVEVTSQESQQNKVTEVVNNTIPDKTQIETTTAASDEEVDDTTVSDDEKETEKETETEAVSDEKPSDNPADWSKEKIVDVYRKAAKKSYDSSKSNQSIILKKISVNNGEFEGLFDFIMPIMSKLLANNSKETVGITGGYNNLSSKDLLSAKAYKSGDNVVIEMIMNNQTSGPRENALSGSVGHAITAVGDIGVVTDQLTDLGIPLELSDKDTKIYYTNPVVKVVINDGKIIKGTWRYTVEIRMDNYKAFGKAVDTTSIIMDNIITVG